MMNLFDEEESIYAFDSDALVTLERYYSDLSVFDALWQDLSWLALAGRFKVLDFVYDEVVDRYKGDRGFLKSWLKKQRKHCYWETGEKAMIFSQRVINENVRTGFLKKGNLLGDRDEADPFLIGNAAVEGFIIVTKEKTTVSNKLPQIAANYGASTISISDFLKDRGFKLQRGV
jgi:hypothetical protein